MNEFTKDLDDLLYLTTHLKRRILINIATLN